MLLGTARLLAGYVGALLVPLVLLVLVAAAHCAGVNFLCVTVVCCLPCLAGIGYYG